MAFRERQQSATAYPINFMMTDSSDHLTGKTGLTPTVTLSKASGAFAAAAGAVSEIGGGWYSLAGNATDRNTLGALILHATATGADPADRDYVIVPYDPFAIYTSGNLPNDPAGVTTLLTRIPGTVSAQTGDAYARIGAAGAGLTALGDTRIAYLDATVSSRSTYAGGDTAGTTTLLGRIAAALTITGGKVDVNDKTGFSLSAAGLLAIWASLTSALTTAGSIGKRIADNLDAAISSRLAPTTPGRTLDVSAAGEAGIDWANIGSPGTVQTLDGTAILSTGSVAHIDAGGINADSFDIDAISASALAASAVAEIQSGLATAATQALIRSDIAEVEAETDDIAAIKVHTDLITSGTSLSLVSAVVGGTITIRRGDTLSATLTGLASLSGWERLWFTARGNLQAADSASLIQVVLTSPGAGSDGLKYLNGGTGTAGQGSITVVSDTSITLALDEAATAALPVGSGYTYDVQMLRAGIVTTLLAGPLAVTADVTRAIA